MDERYSLFDLKLTPTCLSDVTEKYTKTEIDNISSWSNYNTKTTTNGLLNNYYIKSEIDNISTWFNSNTKITTTTSLSNKYYIKSETDHISTLSKFEHTNNNSKLIK